MTARPSSTGRRFRPRQRLWRDERGVAAVEFAFVLPIIVMIFAGIIQFGAIFFLHGNMGNAAREAARALAVGSISTEAEAKTLVQGKLTNWGVNFSIAASIPDPNDPNDTDYTVTITAPLSEAAIIDYLNLFEGDDLTASASMREES